jgi:hypothetical protein
MIGMYNTMSSGVNGVTLKCRDPDHDLDFTDMWDRLVSCDGGDRWPPPSNVANEYGMDLCYGYKPMLPFTWFDYRGGALLDRSASEDAAKLKVALSRATSVFIVVSGEVIASTENSTLIATKTQANRINGFMSEMAEQRQAKGEPFPSVVLIVTKYDYCKKAQISRDRLLRAIKSAYNPLFAPDSDWTVCVAPVHLGLALADNKDSGEIAPHAVEIPICFAAWHVYGQWMVQLDDEQESIRSRTHSELSKSWFERFWDGDNSVELEEQLNEIKGISGQAQKSLGKLKAALIDAPVFHSGKELNIRG